MICVSPPWSSSDRVAPPGGSTTKTDDDKSGGKELSSRANEVAKHGDRRRQGHQVTEQSYKAKREYNDVGGKEI